MPTKKKSDDQGGVPVRTDSRATRHADGVPVQVPATADAPTTPAKTTATKKGN